MEKQIEKIQQYTKRCLNCKAKPCQKGCPLGNDMPAVIAYLEKGEIEKAYEILSQTTVIPSICGRICPHEKQCQGSCVRGIKQDPVAIGTIEAFLGDEMIGKDFEKISFVLENRKVAVIGSGPSGLTCAAFLARMGAEVTIYEKHENLGGLLYYGIPSFRLDPKILQKAIDKILKLGIQVKTSCSLGTQVTIEQLEKEYEASYLAFGAIQSSKMQIPGEELKGVFGGNELLEKKEHPNYKEKTVAVVGGGNVAMDTARTIKRLGAKQVMVIYRRAEEQMPAEPKEIEEARKEGIMFLFQTSPVQILGKAGKVTGIECIKTKLVPSPKEERLVPISIEGSNQILSADYIVMAIGSHTDKELLTTLPLKLTDRNYVKVDENKMTTRKGIFAGGDLTGQKQTVAWAAREGREAAERIKEYLVRN